jgi:hypothetical protein
MSPRNNLNGIVERDEVVVLANFERQCFFVDLRIFFSALLVTTNGHKFVHKTKNKI